MARNFDVAHCTTAFLRLFYAEVTDLLPPEAQARGIRRLINASRYSMAGLKACWRNEAAFRQEAQFAVFMIPAGFWLGTNAVERILLVGSVLLVLIVELLNTAVEAVVDRGGRYGSGAGGVGPGVGIDAEGTCPFC